MTKNDEQKPDAVADQAPDEVKEPAANGAQADSPEKVINIETAGSRRPQQPNLPAIFGTVVNLMIESPAHRHLFLADMQWLIIPPMRLNQYRIFHDRERNQPVGYVSWAFLSQDAAERLRKGQTRLQPSEWKSGEQLWLIDLLAPEQLQQKIIKELKDKMFQGRTLHMLQPAPDGNGLAAVEW